MYCTLSFGELDVSNMVLDIKLPRIIVLFYITCMANNSNNIITFFVKLYNNFNDFLVLIYKYNFF